MFLIQHGHGNGGFQGGKIGDAIRAGDADGVIWSASEWLPRRLQKEIALNQGVEQVLDPQLYAVYAPPPLALKRLALYDWVVATAQGNVRAVVTPTLIKKIVAAALEYQREQEHLTTILGPSMSLSAATGRPLAEVSSYASQSIAWWKSNGDTRPLFVSIPVEENVLESNTSIHTLVGALQRLEVDGFYLLFELNPAVDATSYASRLDRALWLTHRLATTHRVRVGYAGLSGFLYRAAGAEATAAGWYQNRRWWSPNHWRNRSGGSWTGRATLESVLALLTPAELGAVRDADAGVFDQIIAGTGPLALNLRVNPARATQEIRHDQEAAQYFAVCRALDDRVGAGFATDATLILQSIAAAATLRKLVAEAAVTVASGAATDSRLDEWETGLRRLAKRLKIEL
jgi:hypothetical protein